MTIENPAKHLIDSQWLCTEIIQRGLDQRIDTRVLAVEMIACGLVMAGTSKGIHEGRQGALAMLSDQLKRRDATARD